MAQFDSSEGERRRGRGKRARPRRRNKERCDRQGEARLCFKSKPGFGTLVRNTKKEQNNIGVWLSSVERLVRDQEAAGSNPVTPIQKARQMPRLFRICSFNVTRKQKICLDPVISRFCLDILSALFQVRVKTVFVAHNEIGFSLLRQAVFLFSVSCALEIILPDLLDGEPH